MILSRALLSILLLALGDAASAKDGATLALPLTATLQSLVLSNQLPQVAPAVGVHETAANKEHHDHDQEGDDNEDGDEDGDDDEEDDGDDDGEDEDGDDEDGDDDHEGAETPRSVSGKR